ncbi:glycosyltransferase family 4 protein [Salinisphaera sp. SPP-AMP-43]|uniref:glycosyltransferase family 4 protein n=1 Tax=Salinisphaera sp. SPP-AMP-43 TaxID=3121288 RepID=UPI003C6E653E
MNIALVCAPIYPVPPPLTGGTERVVMTLVRELRARGHHVTLFAPEDSTLEVDEHIHAGPSLYHINQQRELVPPGVPGALEAITLDQVAARADAFDVIHAHVDFAHAPALRRCRHKLLTTLHWRVDELDRGLFWRYFDDLHCNAISHDQAERFPGRSCLGVVHHGLETDELILDHQPRDGVAFLGRMTDQKGPDRAIDIAREAGLTIRLAGDIDPGNPGYFDQHVAPRLGPDARHIGAVDTPGKQHLLGTAQALLMPIDWPEPFGLVMIEALACGTPVLAARRGAAAEIVSHGVNGYLYDDPNEAPALLARCTELDPRRVRRSFEARFTADRMVDGYEALYAQIAHR